MTSPAELAPRIPPPITDENRAFWTAGAEGRLMMSHCAACRRFVHPPTETCPACGGPAQPREISGRGTVYTFTVNRHPFHPEVPPPYVVAIVELDEQPGLRFTTNLVDALNSEIESSILPGIAERYGVDYAFRGLTEQERSFLSDAMTGFALCLVGIYLVLAWVFESWTRPIVVMAIIPLGLIGTIWGHWQWGLALSMFTVVGLIGMTGIIINNAIVLIATIDGHGVRRATVPAVVAAAGDRLRPILLTSLTTLLGLAPLLFERSQEALFLKPTVITLVYGLGVGSVLVMVMVPALVVVQRDVNLSIRTLRRTFAVSSRSAAHPGRIVGISAIASIVWLGVTIGPLVIFGANTGPAAVMERILPGFSPGTAAILTLIAGLFVGFGAVLWVTALSNRIRRTGSVPVN